MEGLRPSTSRQSHEERASKCGARIDGKCRGLKVPRSQFSSPALRESGVWSDRPPRRTSTERDSDEWRGTEISTRRPKTEMTMLCRNVGILLMIVIGAMGTAYVQNAMGKLERFVETSARRLATARQVALAKWDARLQVEDTAREAEVIKTAVTAGQSKGLDRDFVSNFFRAQIEANKLVQYSLLADWRRAGQRLSIHR